MTRPSSIMGNSTIHDLLPIPKGTRQPHAYQVFGLEPGEQDSSTIKSAIAATVERLKGAQATTDSQTWSRAAKLVQQARQILCDAEKKSELDARFGIVPVGKPRPASSKPPTARAVDPLAAVLPSSDPLAATLPPTNPLAPVATNHSPATLPPPPAAGESPPAASSGELPPTPPGPDFGSPSNEPENRPASSSSPEIAAPVVLEGPSPRAAKRRRKSRLGSLMFALFSLTMLGLIVLLGYFLVFGPGQVAISRSNRGLTITTGPLPVDRGLAVNPPADASRNPVEENADPRRRPRDSVMGRLAGNVPPPTSMVPREVPETVPSVEDGPSEDGPSEDSANNSDDTPPPDTMVGDSDVPPTTADPMPPAMSPAASIRQVEMTDEMIAAADAKMVEVAELLRAAKWKEMKPAAEQLTEQRLTPSQRERAEALYELADLASFYRGGIERGVASLAVGNDFEVTEAFRVITVETGDDLLVIRFNAKNRIYTFDEFPFALAHKLASFSLPPEAPTTRAAKAVYQAIAPKATDAHRQQAIEWLLAINDEVEGADPKRMAATIASLFGDPG